MDKGKLLWVSGMGKPILSSLPWYVLVLIKMMHLGCIIEGVMLWLLR